MIKGDKIETDDIEEIFKRIIRYSIYCDEKSIKIKNNVIIRNNGEKWGKITVDRNTSTGWYDSPIEWYRSGNCVIFAFVKKLKKAISRIPISEDLATKYIGGVDVKDKRQYLRFENSNREQLSLEYFRIIYK